MLELEELGRRPVLLPCDVVVQLQGESAIRLVAAAAEQLNERPLRLVQIAEGGCRITVGLVRRCHGNQADVGQR